MARTTRPATATRARALASTVQPTTRARPASMRRHNRALVLQALYDGDGLSRADLARAVGLTRATISDLVSDLLDEGLAVELGVRADARPGKPATLLDINRDGLALVALDLSKDSLFRGAVTNLDGSILHRDEVDVAEVVGDAAVAAAEALAGRLVEQAGPRVVGIGIGTPGIVDATGTVVRAPNLGWTDVPLQALLADRLGLPVIVANDANAAVLGERTFGGAADHTMLVRIGRGVGAGIVLAGSLVHGASAAAGEIGHVVVDPAGADLCACGRRGCLETWLAIPRLAARLEGTDDAERQRLLESAGEQLAKALAPVVGALDLQEVVLSGPLDVLEGALLDRAASAIRDRTIAADGRELTVRTTRLGPDIVVLGAAVMALTGQLGVS